MSRAGINNTTFETMVINYKKQNDLKKSSTKLARQLGDDIKNHLLNNKIEKIIVNDTEVKMSTIDKQEFNEDFAIEILKNKFPDVAKKVIQSKEVIKDDLLENECYHNKELSSEIKRAFTVKQEYRLNVK